MVMPVPPGYSPYRRSQIFSNGTIPAGLRSAHRTKVGVWALIHVLEGRLLYRVVDPPGELVLTPDGEPGVIAPEVLHEVAPLGEVRFFVEFHRADEPKAPGISPSIREGGHS